MLPEDERLLWQGQPTVKALLLRVFHLRLVLAYFAALFGAHVVSGLLDHRPLAASVASASSLATPVALATLLLTGLAVLYCRTTRYTITSRRVLLQFGAVLPMTLNVPLKQVGRADLKLYADGSGDLPLGVLADERLSYLLLWPHARPWRLNVVEPMLRGVPEARDVAEILAKALVAASDGSVAAQPLPAANGQSQGAPPAAVASAA
ncbi:photosynthetic complex assembly protein [Bradyrhizobium sp. SSBR45G]|uniref:photosynthetic complex putative assembly protein PuhB n=1 Tax=unclassified Bradyrhizobium TaxID=2631580 RepID=UPI002342A891|nr:MULTISPECIES: photosynthetic complex putative assembly protein PuhB [unclassified Bradyrhizobium]GLH81726.1 photosynthetic complex assembly protein [Bradyrhizobium sp. SSBR45G]GLH89154.1 photosynthetic complex assembly protein [Bradyrhizobium sp. SSBR45R]